MPSDGASCCEWPASAPCGRSLTGSHILPGAMTSLLREQQVVALIGEGRANTEIAAHLLVSTASVKTHARIALEKTGLHTRLLLATRATTLRGD